MHRRKKQLLGLAGLALVAALTALACILPSPGASAFSSKVPVTVTVSSEGELPTVEIESLNNDDIVVRKRFTVTVKYTKATELKVFVKSTGPLGTMTMADVNPQEGETALNVDENCDITYSESPQYCEVPYDLSEYDLSNADGVGFVTRAVAINGTAGHSSSEDSVSFAYRSAYLLDFGGEYVKNGDPIMEAVFNKDEVKSAYVIFCKLDENNACDETVDYKPQDFIGEGGLYKLDLGQMKDDGSLKFALPLWETDAPAGEYRVILMAYSTEDPSNDSLVAVAAVDGVKYTITNTTKPGDKEPDPNISGGPNNPNTPDRPVGPGNPSNPSNPNDPNNPDNPDAPNTGISLFRELNISQADYIITGVVAFGLVTGFAIFLMLRRSKR